MHWEKKVTDTEQTMKVQCHFVLEVQLFDSHNWGWPRDIIFKNKQT
jgi:hypothetical protein